MVRILRRQTSRGFYVTLTLATLVDDAGAELQLTQTLRLRYPELF